MEQRQTKRELVSRFLGGLLLAGTLFVPLARAEYLDPPFIHYFDGREIKTEIKLTTPNSAAPNNRQSIFSAVYIEPAIIHYDTRTIVEAAKQAPKRVRFRIENANNPIITPVKEQEKEIQAAVITAPTTKVTKTDQYLEVLDKCQKSVEEISASNIHFLPGSNRLKKNSLPILKEVVALLNACKGASIVVAGHTDSDGNEHRNQILSGQRAQAVRGKLVKMGIEASRIRAVALGESQPLVENNSKENKALNRRIEFRLY